MSSALKTSNLKLNNWIGSDVPSRADFVSDNQIIDNAVGTHTNDSVVHITDSERTKWNSDYAVTCFYGDSALSRTITLNCDFSPTWGIIFSVSRPPAIIDIANECNSNYYGIFSNEGSMYGLSISGNVLTVGTDTKGFYGAEFYSYNTQGACYVVIAFR